MARIILFLMISVLTLKPTLVNCRETGNDSLNYIHHEDSQDHDNCQHLDLYRNRVMNFEEFLFRMVRLSPQFDMLLINGKPIIKENMKSAYKKFCPELVPSVDEWHFFTIPRFNNYNRGLRKYNVSLKKKYGITDSMDIHNETSTTCRDSILYYRKKIEDYNSYYQSMLRLSDVAPLLVPFFCQEKGKFPIKIGPKKNTLALGFVMDSIMLSFYFRTELKVSESVSPKAFEIFKQAKKASVTSDIFTITSSIAGGLGALGTLVGLIMYPFDWYLNREPEIARSVIRVSLVSGAGSLGLFLISIPFSMKRSEYAKKGYFQYDKDLREKYDVPDRIFFEGNAIKPKPEKPESETKQQSTSHRK